MPVARVLGCAPHMVLTSVGNERPKSVREWETLAKGTKIAQGPGRGGTGQLLAAHRGMWFCTHIHMLTCAPDVGE